MYTPIDEPVYVSSKQIPSPTDTPVLVKPQQSTYVYTPLVKPETQAIFYINKLRIRYQCFGCLCR